jgi:hypothetical protein
MLQHEEELEVKRLHWLAVSQGLLFTAHGFISGKHVVMAVYGIYSGGLICNAYSAYVLARG